MLRRIVLTLSSAAWLSGLYLLYALFVSPWIEPPVLRAPVGKATPVKRSVREAPVENMRLAELYLPQEPWTRTAKYQLRLAETFIYTQEWEREGESSEIRFKPFAMIFMKANASPDEEPFSIISDSAVIRFASEFEMANPKPGRIIGGSMEGNVRIRGPGDLSVQGRNFIFSEGANRLWSDNQVAFTYGPHSGSGHGLQMDLISQEPKAGTDRPAIAGIRNISIRRKVRIELRGEQKDPAQPVDVVEIRSEGSLQYLLESNMLSFENNVRVLHPTGGGQRDALACERLTFVLAEVSDDGQEITPTESNPEDPATWFPGRLEFQRLLAEGTDAKPALLVSERIDLRAEVSELTYDGQNQLLVLRHPREVRVWQGPHEIHCPEITILHNANGDVTSAVARGAGWLKSLVPDRGQLVAEWLRQMRKYPSVDGQYELVELDGKAALKHDDATALRSDFIKLWLKPDETAEETARGKDASSPAKNSDKRGISEKGTLPPLQLERLLALRDVHIESPQLRGKSKRLEVWFDRTVSPESQAIPIQEAEGRIQPAVLRIARNDPAVSPASKNTPRRSVRPRTPTRSRSDVSQPQAFYATGDALRELLLDPDPDAASIKPEKPAKPIEPVDVVADLIQVRLRPAIENPKEMEVAEIWGEGGVQITQEHLDGESPLGLRGERVNVKNISPTQQEVWIQGTPAHIQERGMHLEGGNIHLNRHQNLVWVEGPGLIRLPVTSTLDGKELERPQTLEVWWKEGMEFDGQTASFHESVRTVLEESRMRCETMKISLSDRLSFSDENPEAQTETIKIRHVDCQDGVELDQYEYEDNKLVGVRKGSVWQFTADNLTGKVESQGPGSLVMWRRGRGNRAGLGVTTSVKANRPLKQDQQHEWEYTRVEFSGKMRGNLNERFTTFSDRVQIVYGPVERSTDTVDPDELKSDGGWMRSDLLQFTYHDEQKSIPAYIQVLATGNVTLEGHTFHARADSVSYDESKGLYMLRSLGTHKATIWRQSRPGANRSRADAQRMEFNPSRNELKLDRTTGLDGLPEGFR